MTTDPTKNIPLIVVALIAGLLMFALVVLLVSGIPPLDPPRLDLYFSLGLLGAVVAIGGSLMLPRAMDRATEEWLRAQPQAHDESLAARFLARTIASCALLEAGALLNLVLHLLTPSLFHLLAVVVLIVFMGLRIPSHDRIQRWMAQRREGASGRKVL